ncbi:MAG: hypothetical protein J6W44_00170 [Oscillospiraceae bacterium]|nr:hypothetical protein [Oscillospiraceae bacterium]
MMIKLYSMEKTKRILSVHSDLIDSICTLYHLPSACLKAILLMEIPEIDLMDLLADASVRLNWFRYSLTHSYAPERHTRNPLRKYDSSTGYGQIFSRVAIEAVLFARSRGIPVDIGLSGDLSPSRPEDLQRVWLRLHRDTVFNLNCAALNLLHAAFQMTGRLDFVHYTEEEMKLVFTRYNGNVKQISAYGEKAYRYYLNCL